MKSVNTSPGKKQKPNVVVPIEKMEAVSAILNATAYVLVFEHGDEVACKSKGTFAQKAGLIHIAGTMIDISTREKAVVSR